MVGNRASPSTCGRLCDFKSMTLTTPPQRSGLNYILWTWISFGNDSTTVHFTEKLLHAIKCTSSDKIIYLRTWKKWKVIIILPTWFINQAFTAVKRRIIAGVPYISDTHLLENWQIMLWFFLEGFSIFCKTYRCVNVENTVSVTETKSHTKYHFQKLIVYALVYTKNS